VASQSGPLGLSDFRDSSTGKIDLVATNAEMGSKTSRAAPPRYEKIGLACENRVDDKLEGVFTKAMANLARDMIQRKRHGDARELEHALKGMLSSFTGAANLNVNAAAQILLAGDKLSTAEMKLALLKL